MGGKMSVSEPDVVDVIGTDSTSGRVSLMISDHLEWGSDTDEHVEALQLKLQRYLEFIRSGQLHEAYPKAADREIEIEIVQMLPPDSGGRAWLERARARLAAENVALSWYVLPADEAESSAPGRPTRG